MIKKTKVAVVCGGQSGEHDVSLVSARSIAQHLSKDLYDVRVVGIDLAGGWRELSPSEIAKARVAGDLRLEAKVAQSPQVADRFPREVLNGIDVVFPIVHGSTGEDGWLQGLLEFAGLPYVGSGVLGSAVCMDKDVAKRLLMQGGVPVVPWVTLRKALYAKSKEKWRKKVLEELGLPLFVKPANAGSSVGVHKVKSAADLDAALEDAFSWDSKVLCEKAIAAVELEVSVLGPTESPQVSIVGEVVPTHEFYSYEAKYLDPQGANFYLPARSLNSEMTQRVQELAAQAYTLLECRGMARVDFFLDQVSKEVYLNEANTLPGFTSISQYPKLWEVTGVAYSELLHRLVQLALSEPKRMVRSLG